jgi:hypothetical protein
MKSALVLVLVLVFSACTHPLPALSPSLATPLPQAQAIALDTTPKERRRMVPPEVYLRAYLGWFGNLVPLDVQTRAKPKNLFDAWDDYLAALGLPDYRIDLPRQGGSNTLMLATLGRLGEALCVRAAEHDLHVKTPIDQRAVFAFDAKASPSPEQFAEQFDVLHRTFLGYPARLAPKDRVARFYTLYQYVAAHHARAKQPLTGDESAWAAVCSALVQHPETELY